MTIDQTEYSGVTEGTPELVAGYQFRLGYFTINTPTSDSLSAVHELHSGRGAFMALGAIVGDQVTILGSAAIIAPGVAVTAKHVLDEVVATPECDGLIGFVFRADYGVTYWHASHYHPIGNSDVVIMAIKPLTHLKHLGEFHQPIMHAREPKLGERLTILGFRGSALAPPDAVELSLLQTTGRVTAVYSTGRDSVLLPNPCIEVDCDVVGGMSGGPTFDEAGHLVGVASTSVGSNIQGARPAFVSLIWPAVPWTFKPIWPPGLYETETTLKELTAGLPAGIGIDNSVKKDHHRFACVIDAERVISGKTEDDRLFIKLLNHAPVIP